MGIKEKEWKREKGKGKRERGKGKRKKGKKEKWDRSN